MQDNEDVRFRPVNRVWPGVQASNVTWLGLVQPGNTKAIWSTYTVNTQRGLICAPILNIFVNISQTTAKHFKDFFFFGGGAISIVLLFYYNGWKSENGVKLLKYININIIVLSAFHFHELEYICLYENYSVRIVISHENSNQLPEFCMRNHWSFWRSVWVLRSTLWKVWTVDTLGASLNICFTYLLAQLVRKI